MLLDWSDPDAMPWQIGGIGFAQASVGGEEGSDEPEQPSSSAAKQEDRAPWFFLRSERDRFGSRSTVTIAAGEDLQAGAVLGRLGSGEYVAFDAGGNDGREIACAILGARCDATAGAVRTAVIVRQAVVCAQDLVWREDQGEEAIAVGSAELVARGILLR